VAGNPLRGQEQLCKPSKRATAEMLEAYGRYLARNAGIVAACRRAICGQHRTVAVMCFERAHADCHRSILLERIAQSGADATIVFA